MQKIIIFLRKYSPPILDFLIVLGFGIILAPFQPLPPKIFIILLFVVYHFGALIFNKNRTVGMAMVNNNWKEKYSQPKQLFYITIYTVIFASIFYHIFFPFDLLLVNVVLLQLPTLFYRGMYFQNYLAGRMEVVAS